MFLNPVYFAPPELQSSFEILSSINIGSLRDRKTDGKAENLGSREILSVVSSASIEFELQS